jgi:Zn-dependent peptidase ImmA (M78 family)/transcriptional regulator with XRE-family HTH domain
MTQIEGGLARARERARYSQDDVGAALGVSRAMVSYWEAGTRAPNDRQLAAIARLYGVDAADLIEGRDVEPAGADLTGMLLRADGGIDPASAPGVHEFVLFLERYAELSRLTGLPIRGLRQSPFVHRARFAQKDDARRKAEEVRAYLELGMGPVPDIDAVCDMLGLTVYRAPLGSDLTQVPSGAFLNHPEVGFAILVNLDMTVGRRRFTVAHEIAHALFHSGEGRWVVSHGKNPREAFADEFAGEFLMPSEGVRRFMEEAGLPPRITDAVHAIHIQRYFRTSFPTTLVRLRQMNAITSAAYEQLRDEVQPVALARSLGYPIDPEEYAQDAELWRIRRFPRAFLRMLREAVVEEVMSPPTAASFAGLSIPDLVQILGQPLAGGGEEPAELRTEFAEFEKTGVV